MIALKDIANESVRRDAPERLRAVTHTASTTKGCKIALSIGPMRKLCFGCVRRMCLPAPLRSYLVARSSKSATLDRNAFSPVCLLSDSKQDHS